MKTLTKRGLAADVADRAKVNKLFAISLIDAVCESIVGHFQAGGETVTIRGFGTFTKRTRKPFRTKKLNSETAIHVPAQNIITFKLASDPKTLIN